MMDADAAFLQHQATDGQNINDDYDNNSEQQNIRDGHDFDDIDAENGMYGEDNDCDVIRDDYLHHLDDSEGDEDFE